VSATLDPVDGFRKHGTHERFRPSENDDPDTVLLAPYHILAVGDGGAIHKDILKRVLGNSIRAHTILRVPTHGHVA